MQVGKFLIRLRRGAQVRIVEVEDCISRTQARNSCRQAWEVVTLSPSVVPLNGRQTGEVRPCFDKDGPTLAVEGKFFIDGAGPSFVNKVT